MLNGLSRLWFTVHYRMNWPKTMHKRVSPQFMTIQPANSAFSIFYIKNQII